MVEAIIDGINYRLNEETKTAEVIRKENGYEGDITIPETVVFNERTYRVTSIRSCAFNGSSALLSITIPNSVTSIGNEAFEGCKSLTSINVESGNSMYDSRENCDAIIETDSNTLILGCQNTIIPNSVTNIGEDAFFECSNLTSITIPDSVTSIGENAFDSCSKLTSLTIPNSVKSIGEQAFYGCASLTSINVESGNSIYDSRENCDAIIETDSNTLILGCQNTIIPDGVINIGEGAFYECSNLTFITIPNSVTNIGSDAFHECSNLTSITIPNSVTKIGHWSFKGCSNLISITIPNSVKNIGDSAFFGCTSLTSISFQGTIVQWKKIEFRDDWNDEVPATVVHCTDGDVEI